MAKKGVRKKLPKEVAVINADNCTGCESCLEVCPVDCIELRSFGLGVKGNQSWCEIDIERCVGCEVCVHIPGKKSNPYELTVCPWNAIELVPTEQVAQVVAQIGGPESGDTALFYANSHHLGALSCGRARRSLPERSLP